MLSSGEPRHRHRSGLVAGGDDVTGVVRRVWLLLACANAAVGASFVVAPAGQAPSTVLLQAVAPLYVWGAGFAVVALLLLAGRHVPAHLLGVPLWGFWGVGAVLGLVGGSTRSPAVTLALTGLVLCMAGWHVNGLAWRSREARARRGP